MFASAAEIPTKSQVMTFNQWLRCWLVLTVSVSLVQRISLVVMHFHLLYVNYICIYEGRAH